MKSTTLNTLICGLALLLGATAPALAAGYLKFDGVDGEAQDKDHKNWSEIQSVQWGTAKPGQILIGLTRGGQKIPLTRDGRYSTGDGKMIIVINGKIARITAPTESGAPAGVVAPSDSQALKPQTGKKPLTPGERKGFNPQPEPPPQR